jgi:hypothetical protein
MAQEICRAHHILLSSADNAHKVHLSGGILMLALTIAILLHGSYFKVLDMSGGRKTARTGFLRRIVAQLG